MQPTLPLDLIAFPGIFAAGFYVSFCCTHQLYEIRESRRNGGIYSHATDGMDYWVLFLMVATAPIFLPLGAALRAIGRAVFGTVPEEKRHRFGSWD